MLFNTIDFIIFFIFVCTIFVIIKNRKFQHIFLVVVSYFFFYYSSNYLIILLVFTTIWDFYFGKMIFSTSKLKQKKIILILSLAGNLGLLGFFKYGDFTITQINIIGNYFNLGTNIQLLNLALPIAISFYTFHSITYTVSIYRGLMKPAESFIDYAIFVAFFPQLVAGPILRATTFLPQLREEIQTKFKNNLRQITIQNSNLRLGITMMSFGFLKKMFFADNISTIADEVFRNPVGLDSFSIIIGTLAFGIQIYCDFSGYSDIAIGAALVLGFKLPLNFNKPYFATSPSDFWKRWHISLSSWLRDYLYISLGGNRKSRIRTSLNLMITMLLGGLWHGASWNFVLWGALHGVYLVFHKLIIIKIKGNNSELKFPRYVKIFSIFMTQYLVFLAWIPFRAKNTSDMLYSVQKYVFLDFQYSDVTGILNSFKFPLFLIALFLVLSIITFKKREILERIARLKLPYWFLFLSSIIVLILFFYAGDEKFIYFKF